MAQPLTDAIEALTTYANTVTGASDTTLSDAVATLASGYGGGDAIFSINNINGNSDAWRIKIGTNTLSSGGSLEIVFSDPTPATDYGSVLDFGNYADLGGWTVNDVTHIYHQYTESTKQIVIRQGSTSTGYQYDTTLTQHTVKIDKDYVYVDGTAVVATISGVINTTNIGLGSYQGTKRFQGTYHSVTYK